MIVNIETRKTGRIYWFPFFHIHDWSPDARIAGKRFSIEANVYPSNVSLLSKLGLRKS